MNPNKILIAKTTLYLIVHEHYKEQLKGLVITDMHVSSYTDSITFNVEPEVEFVFPVAQEVEEKEAIAKSKTLTAHESLNPSATKTSTT